MLNKALNIAYKAHIGQLDKGGSPYILHPVRVALHCQTEDEKIVALLHAVVEDTSITFEDLKTEGLDDRLLEALKCLIKEEGEDYKAFIERVSTNRLATKVKIQDLKDNMDVTRLNGKAHWKLETYKEALEYLERCSNKKVLYVDMDNVLVNFQSGIDALNEDLKSRYAGCYDEVPNIFAKMQPNEGAIDAMNRLKEIPGMRILGEAEQKGGVISFLVGDIHHFDMGTLLDRLGIAVRTGHHCAEPLMHRLGIEGTVRASLGLYNTKEEIDALVEGVLRVSRMFA